jgi:cytochrome P450
LIERYGPIVVIAPDQVHTNDETAMKTIYDKSSIKTRFYANMGSWKGVVSTLGKLDYASAGPTRTNLIQCFQSRNLEVLAEHIDQHVFQFVETMSEKARNGENIDGVIWFRLLALDIVTDVLWGEDTDLLGHAGSETPAFLKRFFAFSKYNAMKSFIPIIDPIAKYVGPPSWSKLRKDCLDMDVTAKEALARWNEKEVKTHDRDVLSMLSSMDNLDDPQHRITPEDLPAYMVEMMAAGSSTTSHTAAFACWALANNPKAQYRLRQELFDIFPDPKRLDMKATQRSDYLDAVIKETMRLWPMIPGPLERYLGKPIEVNGLYVSPGVIASTSAFTSGRKPDVYPEPEKWNPDRWLEATERMRLNWTPFGCGSRVCPGSNLALTELKYMLGALFRNMRSIQPKDVPWEPIELADVFAAGSRSGHCWLRFELDSETT